MRVIGEGEKCVAKGPECSVIDEDQKVDSADS